MEGTVGIYRYWYDTTVDHLKANVKSSPMSHRSVLHADDARVKKQVFTFVPASHSDLFYVLYLN